MKKRFYLLRHGEKVKQIGNPPLSEKGVLQAKATGTYFKTLPIQRIITSPILRAQQTAQQIADALALQVITHKLLKERVNWGDDPTQNFESFLAMWERASADRDWIPQVGDSSRHAGERLNKFIYSQNDEVNQVILVTHGGIITDFLRNVFSDEQLDAKFSNFTEMKDQNILGCSVTIVDFDPKIQRYDLVELASTKHLKDLVR